MADQPETLVIESPVDQPTEIILPEKASSIDIAASSEKEVEAAEPEVPEYSPNYKYKVYDEEMEMPDWARGFVKNKDQEEQFRTLFAKSGGFDGLKSKYDDVRNREKEISTTHNKVLDNVSELQHWLDNDLHTFFERTKVPESKIIDYVKQRLNYRDMSPVERQSFDQGRQNLIQVRQTQQQASALQEQNTQLMKNHHELEYQRAMELPEVSDYRSKFEEKLGKGSFRQQADSHGNNIYLQTGRNISPLEAINHVMTQYAKFFSASTDASNPSDLIEAKKERESRRPGGTIPNVGRGASTVSPTRPRFKSLADMKKHIASLSEG